MIFLVSVFLSPAHGQFLEWAVNASEGGSSAGRAITVDNSGNVYMSGVFNGTSDFDPGSGSTTLTTLGADDIFIQKLNSAGNFIWVKQIGGVGEQRVTSIKSDNIGNVVIGGYFIGSVDFDPGPGVTNISSGGNYDIFILKLDASGNMLWIKTLPGTQFDWLFDLELGSNGNIYATGSFSNTIDFDPGSGIFNLSSAGIYDCFVLKLDNSGNFIWATRTGGSGVDEGRTITVDDNENVVIGGEFKNTVDFDPGNGTFNLTSVGETDIFFQKLTSDGNFVWAKSIGTTTFEYIYASANDSAGGLYFSGEFFGIMDADPGSGVYNIGTVSSQAYNIKLDQSGNLAWANAMGTQGSTTFGQAITTDHTGVYFQGIYAGTIDLDPGAGAFLLNSYSFDVYHQKLSFTGNFLSGYQITPGGDDWPGDIVSDGVNFYSTGSFEGIPDFDPGAGVFNLMATGGSNAFVQKVSWLSTGLEPQTDSLNLISIYPNPFDDELQISFSDISDAETIVTILNAAGQVVYTENVNSVTTNLKIDLKNTSQGIYFVKINNDKYNLVGKVVKR